MTLGTWRRFQLDDYTMIAVLCFYTTLIATINIIRSTSSNLLPKNFDVSSLTHEDVSERQFGSRLVLVVEQCQCVTIWGAKACLLIMYLRLTTMRTEHILIWCLIGYVAFSFVFMEIFYFAVWCRPFTNYWAVPTPNPQCNAATNHLITNAVFNLSSDCIMLAIGLPMFLRMRLPWKKKLPLIGIFSLGIFVILAAVLNKVYSFSEPFGAMWTYWYVRESSTALLVANLPFVWAFWRRITGHKSVSGMSRDPSRTPMETLSRNGKTSMKRKDSERPKNGLNHEAEQGDLETGEGFSGAAGLTLDDMLSESNPVSTNDGTVSPLTHPSLFFARGASNPGTVPRAVVGEGSTRDLIRRDTEPDFANATTPVSSVFPSLNSQKSAGSFL